MEEKILYRSGFDIKVSKNSSNLHNGFLYLQNKTKFWLEGQLNKNKISKNIINNDNFYSNFELKLKNIELQSHVCKYDVAGHKLWAIEIKQPDQNEKFCYWLTRICIQEKQNRLCFFQLQNSFVIDGNACFNDIRNPSFSIPRIIGAILNDKFCYCQSGAYQLSSNPILINDNDVETFYKHIQNNEIPKNSPCVLITPIDNSNQFCVDPYVLATKLQGMAQVFYINSESVREGLKYFFKRKFFMSDGAVRIYMPDVDNQEKYSYKKHRYITRTDFENKGEIYYIDQIIKSIIRKNTDLKSHSYLCVDDIKSVEREYRIREIQKQSAVNNKENGELLNLLDKDNQQLKKDKDNLLEEISREKFINETLQNENKNLKRKFEANLKKINNISSKNNSIVNFSEKMDNVLDIFESFNTIYPNRLACTAQGEKSLKDCSLKKSNIKTFCRFWNAFCVMADYLWNLGMKNITVTDPVHDFNNKFDFELSLCEGTQTNKAGTFKRLRSDQYEGIEIDITHHLKIDHNKNRFYFSFVSEKKLIVIGFLGHLDTYGTKRNAKP